MHSREILDTDPIAIVGMSKLILMLSLIQCLIRIGCRLPGGVTCPESFWEFMLQKKSGYCDFPSTRFNGEAFHHPDPDHPGTLNSAGGCFLQGDVRLFDNEFFGINNLEAKHMDPQQRQLLEVVYECFESAGMSLQAISGKNIGCYVANFTMDYLVSQTKDPELYHRYTAAGVGCAILANRLSHVFNLKGPSSVTDTACSSSLYCVDQACKALEAGDCDMAIVAGANLILSPELHIAEVKAGFLSATSACHSFDKSADGYCRAEGVAALLLTRHSTALRNGDPIRSIIRGTATNRYEICRSNHRLFD